MRNIEKKIEKPGTLTKITKNPGVFNNFDILNSKVLA